MISILIVILTTASFNVMFKIFDRLGVNTLLAIVFNYITALVISLLMSPISFSFSEIVTKGWFYTGVILGVSYFSSLYLYSFSTRHLGVALTALLTRTSLILPTLAALLFFDEKFTPQIAIAVVLIIVAMYFIFYSKESSQKSKSNLWIMLFLPLTVFLICGVNDVVMKSSQFFFIKNEQDNSSFISIVYMTALLFGATSYFLSKKNRVQKVTLKTVLCGVVMGVVNITNSIFVLKALREVAASVAFPIINTGIVVISTFIGVVLFKESLTKRKVIGIVIALAAIVLLQ